MFAADFKMAVATSKGPWQDYLGCCCAVSLNAAKREIPFQSLPC